VSLRLLVVEDELIIQLSLTRLLERLGHTVVATASSGPEAVEQVRATQPDVVLMDVRLSGGTSGIEAARQIREISAAPVIFATAHTEALAQELSRGVGVYRSVAKPFSLSQLKAVIEQVRPRATE
jgi:two-component system, response regulator PdtaR